MKNLEKLKSLIDLTPICLVNHFNDLRTQIDVSFAVKEEQLLTSLNDSVVKLKENWTLMIKKVNLIEKECLYRLKTTTKLNKHQMNDLLKRVNLIELNEAKLNDQQLNDLINNELDQLEKHFFLNKTVIYLDEDMCDKLNILYKMDTDTTAGKLIIIKDFYLNSNCLKQFKNLNQDLTNENLKCQELIQMLKKNSHYEQILELKMDLDKLKEFNLKWHHLVSVKWNLFQDFKSLISIDLSWNSLKQISLNLFNDLFYLEYLDLSWNKLNSIDLNSFKNLSSLITLNLSNNQIKTLFGVLSGTSSLINLDLSNNLLERIDFNLFEDTSNLQSIDLHKNNLSVLKSNIFKGLDNLSRIDLSHNKLTKLNSDLFNGLKSLALVELKENNLSLYTLVKLKYLQVNRLISIHSFQSKINIIK